MDNLNQLIESGNRIDKAIARQTKIIVIGMIIVTIIEFLAYIKL